MSEVDQYEYLKSCEPQGVNLESPYVSKQWNFTNDINQGEIKRPCLFKR